MKFWVTCTECGEEVKHDFGGGKKAEAAYERMKDDFVCDTCREKARQAAYEAKKAADIENKLADGWKWESVHYAEWVNKFRGMVDNDGNEIVKGEYDAETKHISILCPPALIEKHFVEDEPEAEEAAEEPVAEEKKWHRMDVEESHVLYRTNKSIKVAMPGLSDYSGYIFWHPLKCFREYGDGRKVISFSSDWNFRLEANGGALHKEISADEMLEYANDFARYEKTSDLYQPLPIAPIENPVALEELVDND